RSLLLASSGPTGLWALDPNDGRTLWRRTVPEGGVSAPVPIAGALLVTSTRYGVFLFSPLDGATIDGIDTGGGIAMTPAAFGRRAPRRLAGRRDALHAARSRRRIPRVPGGGLVPGHARHLLEERRRARPRDTSGAQRRSRPARGAVPADRILARRQGDALPVVL